MLTIWIVHRQPGQRAALARIAGSADSTVLGGPEDRLFESATPPDVILLGLSGDFEVELDFAHRTAKRVGGRCSWIIVAPERDLAEAQRLFDTVPAEFLRFPPNASDLRFHIRTALSHRSAPSLSRRMNLDALSRRFTRWFADLDLPELMRALDPRLARVPLLLLGEEGSGRGLLARYIHAYGGASSDGFIHVACREMGDAEDILAQLASADLGSDRASWTVWLEDVDELPGPLQLRAQDWVEYGLPEGSLRAAEIRWIASAADPSTLAYNRKGRHLEPGLALALSGMQIRIPPLRDRPHCVEAFAVDTALAWCRERNESLRSFSPEAIELLTAYPWPGNLRELDSVITRTLSRTIADPILPTHLCFEGSEPRPTFDDRETEERVATAAIEEIADAEPTRLGAAEARAEATLPEAEIVADIGDIPGGEHDVMLEALAPGRPELETPVLGKLEEDIEGEFEAEITGELEEELEGAIEAEITGELEEELEGAIEAEITGELEEEAGDAPVLRAVVDDVEALPWGEALRDDEHIVEVAAPPPVSAATEEHEPDWPRLVRAVAHEIRNPLVSIRTFSELLPQRYDDDEFRARFTELVGDDVRRIDEVVSRLHSLTDTPETKPEPVDIAELLDGLLDERRAEIQARRLLVLKELDRERPLALVDADQLGSALSGILTKALALVPDHGDVYIASRHHATGLRGAPMLRILLRYNHRPAPSSANRGASVVVEGMTLDQTSLEIVIAEKIVTAHSGSLTLDTSDGQETVLIIDLPAPTE